MSQQTVKRFNLFVTVRPVCTTQTVVGLQRPTITPGQNWLTLYLPVQCLVLGKEIISRNQFIQLPLFHSWKWTNPSSLLNLLFIHWSQAFLCQASHLYIRSKNKEKMYWKIQILTLSYFWFPPSGKLLEYNSLPSQTRKQLGCIKFQPTGRDYELAMRESLKWDSKMCLSEYCHWKPLNRELLIQKLLLEEPKENVDFWLQTEKSANSFEIQMPTLRHILRHIWKQTLALLI